MSTTAEKSKEARILELSDDGDNLAPKHLSLVQASVNGRLNEKGERKIDEILEDLENGEYEKPYYLSVEGMRKDHEGYIYYKGTSIEHYSYKDKEREREALEELASRCRRLERQGHSVNRRNLKIISDKKRRLSISEKIRSGEIPNGQIRMSKGEARRIVNELDRFDAYDSVYDGDQFLGFIVYEEDK